MVGAVRVVCCVLVRDTHDRAVLTAIVQYDYHQYMSSYTQVLDIFLPVKHDAQLRQERTFLMFCTYNTRY